MAAAAVPRYRCLNGHTWHSPFRVFLTSTTATPSICRSFATTTEPPTIKKPQARVTTFVDKLNAGPSFSDFVGGKEPSLEPSEAYALKTALVGPKGKQREITRLPSWLK